MSELHFVSLDERAYKYIRQFTIKSAEDALVELITNCIDAYIKGGITNKIVDIEYHEQGILIVRDFAIGLSGAAMEKCFLQVGGYTNVEGSRGFFSRGAKDISAIGDIVFETIKDNKYSKVLLNSDAYGMVEINEAEATTEIRDNIGLTGLSNGLVVSIYLLDNFKNFTPSGLCDSLEKLCVLRDIMSNTNNTLNFFYYDSNKIRIFHRILTYTFPNGTLLLEIDFNIPGYDGKVAKFTVFKTDKFIPQPKKENELEFGFLLKDSTTIYEGSTLDDRFRWNPYISYLYGSLVCEHIHEYLLDYDINGATMSNPVPIIDPSRLTGLNKEHPFIIALLGIPKVRLDQILRELNTSLSQQSISLAEANDLFDELSKFGLDVIEHEEIRVSFIPSYDSNLAKAIEDDRMNYITSEKSYLLTSNFDSNKIESDQYIQEEIIRITPVDSENNYIYVAGDNGELIPIPYPKDAGNLNEINILDVIDDSLESNLTTRPYIYQIDSNGNLLKLYIFEKGKFEYVTNPENDYVLYKNKKFSISFINDINIIERYIIEYENGIHIKINTHNKLVRKYLVKEEWQTNTNLELTIDNITSTKSLVFLKDLMIEILAEIILESDILNNRLILDSNNFNNIKRSQKHRNQIIARLEEPLEGVFDKYLGHNFDRKLTSLSQIMDQISLSVGSKINLEEEGGDIVLLKIEFDNMLSLVLE